MSELRCLKLILNRKSFSHHFCRSFSSKPLGSSAENDTGGEILLAVLQLKSISKSSLGALDHPDTGVKIGCFEKIPSREQANICNLKHALAGDM